MSQEIENFFNVPRVSNNTFLDLSKVNVFILKLIVQIIVKCVFLITVTNGYNTVAVSSSLMVSCLSTGQLDDRDRTLQDEED